MSDDVTPGVTGGQRTDVFPQETLREAARRLRRTGHPIAVDLSRVLDYAAGQCYADSLAPEWLIASALAAAESVLDDR